MSKFVVSALGGLAALAMTVPASAALVVTVSPPAGTFGNDSVTGFGTTLNGGTMGAFSDTVTFAGVTGFNIATLTITSGQADGNLDTNINFSSVVFNGATFTPIVTGQTEFQTLMNSPLLPSNTLTVTGSSGFAASYSGTITLASAPAVPEPSTWAMMLVGFGAVGYGMRRRARVTALQAA